ncbi:potassium transporter Kup [Lichenihabitans sp. Uapishka_5]|uniref:potassium transporter Kup n=1 Tax=Lichenihabitans sp. Uapishka_5 TaxID=3037302 RepID=UPI0029E7D19A|nr:potassium transporter Kup [Lichenihabitans sp. Uapishka_5]MDX7952674.1 potassium transporter Kup [Lichenihabitans sp. Uapishka_5]
MSQHRLRPALLLGALGVVFGDIGTSPIYALRESLRAAGPAGGEQAVFGVVSLVIWAILIVVALKYVVFVMRADNAGEGGTMALLSLALRSAGRRRPAVLLAGLVGASLFLGDAMITPAISVLSAVEGLKVAAPPVAPYVVPIAAAVLLGLFSIQSRGSGRVGLWFGPVMAVWFVLLGGAGLVHLVAQPRILLALNPACALAYAHHAGFRTLFTVLGSVFLALTGGEALYADMGHFGRTAIRLTWFAAVLPALGLAYLGQGALVLADPAAARDPFFSLFPGWSLVPVVILSTAATVIASQAVISGAFGLVRQAIQLGVVPRLTITQTSAEEAGQVYAPQVNWLLAIAVLGLVFGFGSSDALANAYGIAVSGDMLVTTILVSLVALAHWRWPRGLVVPVAALFGLIDLTFVASNVHKIPAGGWFPLLVGAVLLSLMWVWHKGRAIAFERRDEEAVRLSDFIAGLDRPNAPKRTRGTAVYLTRQTDIVPAALALNVAHNGVVHDHVVLLKVETERAPRVAEADQVTLEDLSSGFRLVRLRFGFAEAPDVIGTFARHPEALGCDTNRASFFIGRETPVPSLSPDLSAWEERLYAFMTRNAASASDYFCIPPERVVELGTRVEM